MRPRMRALRETEDTEGSNPADAEMEDAQAGAGDDDTPEGDAQAPHAGGDESQPGENAETELSLEERHAFIVNQVKQKRIEKEIVMLQQELAGDTPGEYVSIAGTSLPHRKRAASSNVEPILPKQIKLGDPPSFSGKSVKELQTYDVGWNIQFKAMPMVASDAYVQRIATAATYLRGIAAEAWARNATTFTRWSDYMTFLRGVLSDPATRKSEALLSLASKAQKESQTVRELLAEIENLEQDIPPMTEDERRAWVLLNALRPALRAEVIRENKEITSREQVLASAQRHEEVTRQQTKAETPKQYSKSTPMRPASDSWSRRSSASREHKEKFERKETTPTTTRWRGSCFNCGKSGHKSADCRAPSSNRHSAPKLTDASDRPITKN
jgi:hypothetical protein